MVSYDAETALADRRRLLAWLSAQAEINRSRGGTDGWAFSCVEDLVLTHGRWATPTRLPSELRGPLGACFANASRYSLLSGLTYVEGYALSAGGLVFAHAWCVDDQGQAHDPTWPDGSGYAYLGIPFSASHIHTYDEQFGNACLLHDTHLDEHRILREGLPVTAIVAIGAPLIDNARGQSHRDTLTARFRLHECSS